MSDRLLAWDEIHNACESCNNTLPCEWCCEKTLVQAQDTKTANYYETVAIPALYEKWSQESINVRKTTAKELIEEIEQMEDICEILACNIDCLNLKRCKAWQQLKQKRGIE
jgi:hypothetical protein